MKPLIDPINTSDGKFHGKDKQTGDLATIVTPEYMNNDQDATRSMQREIISILTAAGINPEEATDTQLLTALKKVLITADDERVKNALQKENNLSDVVDAAKALGNIGGVPTTRKINGHALSDDANVTAQDIFNGQVVDIGNAVDLNTLTTPGLYRQAANAQAVSGKNYPEAVAGSLEIYKHAGITQVYRPYNLTCQYTRTLYDGTWSGWGKSYDSINKPSAGDVAAIPLAGSTAVTGVIRSSSEIQSTSSTGFRLVHGNYGTFLYQDGANFYLMLTKSGDQYGTFNTLRPLIINLASGAVTIGELNLSNWTHFDARYQAKGSYTPEGEAYTKAQSDSKYPTAFRTGARVKLSNLNGSGDWSSKVPTGAVNIASITAGDDRVTEAYYAYPQYYLNGKWVNFSGA